MEVWAFARTTALILSQQFGFPDCSRLCWSRSSMSSTSFSSCVPAICPEPQAKSRAQGPMAWAPSQGRKVVQKLVTPQHHLLQKHQVLSLRLIPDWDADMYSTHGESELRLSAAVPIMCLFCKGMGQLLSAAGLIISFT